MAGPYTIDLPGCQPYLDVSINPASVITGFAVTAVRAEVNQVKFWVTNLDGSSTTSASAQVFTALCRTAF